MNIGEVLNELEGMTRDQLYYLEARRYITPQKQRAGSIERNDYTEEDVRIVKLIWRYWKEGFPPRVAYQKAKSGALLQDPSERKSR